MKRLAAGVPWDQEDQARRLLADTYACDVRADESMPLALGAFLAAERAPQAVVLAVSLGGDTDTLGAMAGALARAYWGLEAWPSSWRPNWKTARTARITRCFSAKGFAGKNLLTNQGLTVRYSLVSRGLLAQLVEQRTLNP